MGQVELEAIGGPTSLHPCRYCKRHKCRMHDEADVTLDEWRDPEYHYSVIRKALELRSTPGGRGDATELLKQGVIPTYYTHLKQFKHRYFDHFSICQLHNGTLGVKKKFSTFVVRLSTERLVHQDPLTEIHRRLKLIDWARLGLPRLSAIWRETTRRKPKSADLEEPGYNIALHVI
eukprot:TRINITY_DN24183_c0_g1_i1.p2 TRINITY_DN24183_c0_g1~~TRINITY_DN24183_c0_g1_i1.p2  ORF type:complete len:176 (+),score=30.07 TRINITY_DN24183_c0_g1_i1:537-1064(+)